MIIVKVPYRVSFAGGGTDFKEFYSLYPGRCISTTIDKYLYITINKRFDGKIHVRYSEIEEVDNIHDLKHDIIRECLKLFNIHSGIEIVTVSDIPSKGSGLGSSSALCVGMVLGLSKYTYQGNPTKKNLSEMACKIEIDILKHPIGKQDQYACAFGGLNEYIFYKDTEIQINSFDKNIVVDMLEENSMLFYLGYTRNANNILDEHRNNIIPKIELLKNLSDNAELFKNYIILGRDSFLQIGSIITKSWGIKKELSSKSSSENIEKIVDSIKEYSLGIKLCGAGGGGFMLVVANQDNHDNIEKILLEQGIIKVPFKFEQEGASILYVG